MRPAHCTPAALFLFLTLGGCTSYRYDLSPVAGPASQPMDDMPTEVLRDKDLVVPAPPARLRLRQFESRCVLLVENPTDAELTLESSGSAIVDPLGQTHAVATQLIPPGAFTKLILPPLRDYAPAGPAVQFGFGFWAMNDEPRPAVMLQTGRAQDYWDWDGEGRVRIVLSFKQGNGVVQHTYQLQRSKR